MTDLEKLSQHIADIQLPVGNVGSSHDQANDSGAPTLSDHRSIEVSVTSREPVAGVSRHVVADINACIRRIVGFVEHEVQDKSVQALLLTAVVNIIVVSLLVERVQISEF